MLIEVDLPEGDDADPVKLRCFSPPPNDQAQIAQYGGAKAWAVTLDEEDVARLLRLSADVRIVPFGDAKPHGGGWPVDLAQREHTAELSPDDLDGDVGGDNDPDGKKGFFGQLLGG